MRRGMKRLNGGDSVHAVRRPPACQYRAGRGAAPIIDPESVTFGRHAREGGEGEGGRRIRFGKKSKLAIAVVEFI